MAAVAAARASKQQPATPPARARPRPSGKGQATARRHRRPAPAPPAATRSTSLGTLAGRWWTALEAAQSALRAAGPYLAGQELAERNKRLADERHHALEQLQGLAGDLQTDTRLLRLLATPVLNKQTLGLPSTVEACVCDLDGVLTTSARLHATAWAEALDPFLLERAERSRREYIPFDHERDYVDYLAGKTRLGGLRAVLASRGLALPEGAPADAPGLETVHGLANRKNRALQRHLEREGVAAFEGVRCYLEAARMLGLRRAVVSASANTHAILQRAGLAELVDLRIDAAAISRARLRAKPAPDTLLAACQQLELQPQQVAAFETTLAGIAAARAAGIGFLVAVDPRRHSRTLEASDADLVVRDLADLLDRDPAT